MIPVLEPPVTNWECPHCNTTDSTREAQPHTRFHACPGLGITAPMIREGSGARLVKNEREDYEGSEDVRRDADGRPIASISTEYPDGRNDLVVFAPTATAGASAR